MYRKIKTELSITNETALKKSEQQKGTTTLSTFDQIKDKSYQAFCKLQQILEENFS